jgi:hypothetical protein
MWGKREQIFLWFVAYLPMYLIMVYRFIDSNNFFKKTELALWIRKHIDKTFFDFIIILGIILFSLLIYRLVINWFFKGFDEKLRNREIGKVVSIRRYGKLSVNDYSFFLMTLLLPLISLDHKSVINLIVSILIIIIVISIYVKTDTLSVCPLFFTSGRQVYRATMSYNKKEDEDRNPSLRLDVIIITREKSLNLDNKFRAQKLINNIYYLTNK